MLKRLKLGYSCLSAWAKFRHGFKNTLNPLYSCCWCIKAETTTHYFLPCHFHNANWATLMNDLENIQLSFYTVSDNNLKSLLLYGDDKFDVAKNRKNLMSTIIFIKKIHRGLTTLSLKFSDNLPMSNRTSRPQVFLGKGILKICSKFTGEHLWFAASLTNCFFVSTWVMLRLSFLFFVFCWRIISLFQRAILLQDFFFNCTFNFYLSPNQIKYRSNRALFYAFCLCD